jgi:hypothetical protein
MLLTCIRSLLLNNDPKLYHLCIVITTICIVITINKHVNNYYMFVYTYNFI